MYYFQAMKNLIEFRDYILANLDKDISFGDMEFYYILSADYYLKIYEVDLDEFDIPTQKWKGCFGTNISVLIKEWKGE
jgi:hypothetical protein